MDSGTLAVQQRVDYFTCMLINQQAKYRAPSDRLSVTFAALADPTRRAILERLTSGKACVTELARPFDMSLPGFSKHLKVLARAGLIARGKEAQQRPCQLELSQLKEAEEWIRGELDRIEAHLKGKGHIT